MKRLLILGLVVATAAVIYAAAGEQIGLPGLMSRFGSAKGLPVLQTTEMPFAYPADLWRDGIEGEVVLRVHITEAGVVDSVEIEKSSGHPELDEIALRGAQELRYQPAVEDEQPIAVWAILPVLFQRETVLVGSEGS